MINLLYIQPYASQVGGVDTVLLQLVEGLDKTIYKPFVVLPGDSPYVKKYKNAGAEVLFCTLSVFGKPTDALYYPRNFINLMKSIKQLKKIVRDKKINLIHSHKMELIGGNIVGKMLGIPTVQTVHELPRSPLVAYKFVGYLNHLFNDRVVVLCDRSKTMFKWGKFESNKLVKIYNGIKQNNLMLTEKSKKIHDELNLSPDDKIIITVARLSPMKGINYVLKAANELKLRSPKIKFIVVGDVAFDSEKSYKEELFNIKEKLQLDNVYFLGLRRDVNELLMSADIFLLPSVYDIFPTVLLEAMDAQLPVIATDVGGVPEMITDENGILIKPQDEISMSEAILKLLSLDYKSLGEAGKEKVESTFTSELYVTRTTAVYKELLQSV